MMLRKIVTYGFVFLCCVGFNIVSAHAAPSAYVNTYYNGSDTYPYFHVSGLEPGQHYVFTLTGFHKDGKTCGHGSYPYGIFGYGVTFTLKNGNSE